MHLASHIWCVKDETVPTESVMPVLHKAGIDAATIAAKASQRKEQAGPLSIEKAKTEGNISTDTSCSVNDIHVWLSEIRVREDEHKRLALNDSQYAIVNSVAKRICQEMNALAADDYTLFPELLRWSMHGGPGTGGTHVIQMIKEELFQNVLKWDIGVKQQIVAL